MRSMHTPPTSNICMDTRAPWPFSQPQNLFLLHSEEARKATACLHAASPATLKFTIFVSCVELLNNICLPASSCSRFRFSVKPSGAASMQASMIL